MGRINYKLILLISSIILLIHLTIRLINLSHMLSYFPLKGFTDIPTYMARLFWLKESGYGAFIPNWYDGFYLLKDYWPMWFFIALPIYKLTNNLAATVYFFPLLTLILPFLFVSFFSKKLKITKLKLIFIILVTFVNPYTITQLIRLWRGPEILGLSVFIVSFLYIFYLDRKDFKINWKQFLILIFLLSLTLLSYGAYFIFLSLLLIGIGLKHRKAIIASLLILPTLITVTFWFSFISKVGATNQLLLHMQVIDKIAFLVVLPIFWFALYILFLNKKPVHMYGFPLILSVLLFFQLGSYIPVVKAIHASSYVTFFIFLSAYTIITNLGEKIPFKKIILASIIPLVLLSGIITESYVPHISQPEQIDKDTLSLMSYITDRVIITAAFGDKDKNLAFYCYGAIYYNLSTPSGHFYELAEPEKLEHIYNVEFNTSNLNCREISQELSFLKARDIIAYYEVCDRLSKCNEFREIMSFEDVCLYELV